MTPTDTIQLILDTEEKVALQWANASGDTLTHSRGFSFRRPRSAPGKVGTPVVNQSPVRVVLPTRREPAVRSISVALALLMLLFLGFGFSYAAQSRQPVEPDALAPLLW